MTYNVPGRRPTWDVGCSHKRHPSGWPRARSNDPCFLEWRYQYVLYLLPSARISTGFVFQLVYWQRTPQPCLFYTPSLHSFIGCLPPPIITLVYLRVISMGCYLGCFFSYVSPRIFSRRRWLTTCVGIALLTLLALLPVVCCGTCRFGRILLACHT